MDNYKVLLGIKGKGQLKIKVQGGKKLVFEESLTIGQGFDIMLIRTLDKLFRKNKIDRLSLKSVIISGKIASGAMSGMILRSVATALTM